MQVVRKGLFTVPDFFKVVTVLAVLTPTVMMIGCASKPQVSNSKRYQNAPNYYTVRSGDTLSGIAMRYGLNYLSIAAMNDIPEPYRIYVGQSIRLKHSVGGTTTTTQPVAPSSTIQKQTIALPSTTQPTAPTTTQTQPAPSTSSTSLKWVKPSQGPVIQQFNLANDVKGIRYGGNVGDPVYAAANGQVVYAADGLKEYGNLILIQHSSGYITAYAHNSKIVVNVKDNVTAGQKIAELGSSGTTKNMLEFQVRYNGKPIDPTNVLPK